MRKEASKPAVTQDPPEEEKKTIDEAEDDDDDEPTGEPISLDCSHKQDDPQGEADELFHIRCKEEYRNKRFNKIYFLLGNLTAASMPFVFKKLRGSQIEALTIQSFNICGATLDEDVSDQYLPSLIQSITPQSKNDAVCT